MLNLLYFADTVLAFISHFYGLIIRSLLLASLELLSTMSIVAYYNSPQGVVPALCLQLIIVVRVSEYNDCLKENAILVIMKINVIKLH